MHVYICIKLSGRWKTDSCIFEVIVLCCRVSDSGFTLHTFLIVVEHFEEYALWPSCRDENNTAIMNVKPMRRLSQPLVSIALAEIRNKVKQLAWHNYMQYNYL